MKLTQTLVLTAAALGLFASVTVAQELDDHRHNTPEDLANSIRPAPLRHGKEKSEEVDPSKLRSIRIKNTTFEGSLLDPATVKLDKDNSGGGKENSAKVSATNDASGAGKTAKTSGDAEKTSKSSDAAPDGHTQKKDTQTSTTTARSEEKPSPAKNDNADH